MICWSPLLLVLVSFIYFTYAKSHHIRHHRDRFKRQHGAHLYLPGSYVTDNDEVDRGPWLEWSSPSQCSRTCGGGVSSQYRQCTPGYHCEGPTKRHFSCNTQDCPDLADFRAMQCAEFNTIPFEGTLYEWVPYTKSPQPCELNCMPRGERFYYRHRMQVVDGTRCNDESLNVCVEGKCQPVGCDMMLGSDAKEDQCRVCEGDGSMCNTMTGLLSMQDLQVGYNDVLLIPAGAVNIKVREVDRSNNYLAIRNASGHYYLNGNWRIDFPRTLDFAGSRFHYERSPQGFSAPDSITCVGPIEESLFIVLLYQEINVGIHYEYSIPKTIQHRSESETYAWTFDQFSQCSVSCGGGIQHRNVSCAGRKTLEPADSNLCDANNKPVASQKCGEVPCPPKWVAKDWGKCSRTCGDGGTQTRKIYCEQIISNGVASIVDDQHCSTQQRPNSQQGCNQGVVCGEWHIGPWKPCNHLCGKGKEIRKVTCYRKVDGKISVLSDSECSHAEKPDASRSCLLRPCEGVDWVASEWSGCENKCGLSEETRTVQCMTASGEVYPDRLCAQDEEKPETTRKCEAKGPGCEYEWYASQWSECSAKCGSGVQTRKVLCTQITDDGFKKVGDGKCDPAKKYDSTQNCTAEETECPGEWFTGPWSKCTKGCGSGVKTRKVFCIKGNNTAHVKECDPNLTPSSSEECNKQACDTDEIIPVDTHELIEVTESPTEPEGDYVIVEDDKCEDGEWVDAAGIPQPKLGPGEKLISSVTSSLGESTDTDATRQESSLAQDELMQSDDAYIGDSESGQAASIGSEGSADYDIPFGTAAPDWISPFSFGIEGSGDLFVVEEGSGEEPVEVTESIIRRINVYTVGGSISTDYSSTSEIPSTTEIDTEETAFTSETEPTIPTEESVTVATPEAEVTDVTPEGEVTDTTPEGEITDATPEGEITDVTPEGEITDVTPEGEITGTTPEREITDATPEGEITGATPEGEITDTTPEGEITGATPEAEVTDATPEEGITGVTTEQGVTDVTTEEGVVGVTTEEGVTGVTTEEGVTGVTTEEGVVGVTTEEGVVGVTTEEGVVGVTTEEGVVGVTTEEGVVGVTTEEGVSGLTTEEVITRVTTEGAVSQITEEIIIEPSTEKVTEESLVSEITESVPEATSEATEIEPTEKVTTESVIEVSTLAREGEPVTTEISEELGATTKEPVTEITEEISVEKTTTEIPSVEEESSPIVEPVIPEITKAPTITTIAPEVSTEPVSEAVVTEEIEVTESEEKTTKAIEVTTESVPKATEEVTEAEVTESVAPEVSTVEVETEEPAVVGTSKDITTAKETEATTVEAEPATLTTIGIRGRLFIPELTTAEPITTETTRVTGKPEITTAIGVTKEIATEEYVTEETVTEEDITEEVTEKVPEARKAPVITEPVTEKATTEYDIWSSTEAGVLTTETSSLIEIFTTPRTRWCRKLRKPSCKKSEFGCCPDKITAAKGPFDKGCPIPKTCSETKFGCCEDGVSPANGKNFAGCPESLCDQTLFGCCPDNKTPAEGNNYEGCPPPPPRCAKSKFGCCNDNLTEAKGPEGEGCEEKAEYTTEEEILTTTEAEVATTTEGVDCSETPYGCCPDGTTIAQGEFFKGCDIFDANCNKSYYKCCPDGKTSAEGPNYQGCITECSKTAFGCCDDGITPAHGYLKEGCCLSSTYGCCPDNIKPAEGPKLEGCGCEHSEFGCCPDKVTIAKGSNNEGCGCQYTQHGCCPDNHTPASGSDYEGCACHTFQFGCCPDGVTVAKGARNQGCGCAHTEFGCCSDEITAANGPNFAGCDCASSKYGCCPDGDTDAQGENFDGCIDIPENLQANCQLTKDRGPCRNYTVRWFYDMEYGGCSRFWYGNCEGNGNRFTTKDECHKVCVEPIGKDRCNLPKVSGPCEGYYPQWYYDKVHNHCAQFIYSGCLGNNNRFETREECNELCVTDTRVDPCEQPKEQGPCHGGFINWYYNKESSNCEEFVYGGCKGNENNFPTETACRQKCSKPGQKKKHCNLPRAQGNCTEVLSRWYYDTTEERCMPFYYKGCGGNNNNFVSQYHCELDCPKEIVKTACHLAADTGECSNYVDRWYYDTRDKECRQFYYGGCGGNENNFASEGACLAYCVDHAPIETTVAPPQVVPLQVTEKPEPEPFKTEFCRLPPEAGPCRTAQPRWYYSNDGSCRQFMYGGCGGNRNNFETSDECYKMCGDAEDVCNLPMTIGPCNAEYSAWYYNQTTDTCEMFVYGGCMGNGNKFDDLASCEKRCKKTQTTRAPEVVVQPTYAPDDPRRICFKTVEAGDCDDNIPSFYYEPRTQKCTSFAYTGCGGNENRFASEEGCERYCGKYRGHDVCNLPSDGGPCSEYFVKYFYDINSQTCQQFVYGGCEGNGNRFTTLDECNALCGSRTPTKATDVVTTRAPPTEVCLLTADSGTCREGSEKRWFYDNTKGECIAFIYSGCGGNANKFNSHKDCLQKCGHLIDRIYEPQPVPDTRITPQPEPEPPQPDICKQYQSECSTLRCAYGMKGYVENLCNRCKCVDPCEDVVCRDQTRCAVELNRNRINETSDISHFIGICREINKPGDCPVLEHVSDCREDCQDDADCIMDLKCCSNACGRMCLMPATTTIAPPAELRTTERYLPIYTQRPKSRETFAPEVVDEEFKPIVTAGEGDYATLKCAIRGNPKPVFTWHKDDVLIDGREPRYRILLEGAALQIISLYKTDAGIYLCSADNNIGKPLKKEIKLEVIDPVPHATKVIDDQELSNVVVSLGSPAMLNCYAYGYPAPVVMWWKENEFIPFKSQEYTIAKDHSLLINAVKLHNLGVYTCQAYNGVGKATSWSVTVQTLGPVFSTNSEDRKYMKYVIDRPRETQTVQRPQYPYRPGRISTTSPEPALDIPKPTPISTSTPITTITTPLPITTVLPTAPRIYTVPVHANITLTNTNFSIGSDVNIPCDVQGFPIPTVQWYKDGKPLYPSETIQITESHRLILKNVTEADSGEYRCAAWNQYSNATSTVPLLIHGRFIHPSCVDNPFFANCQLIIRGNFCSHVYYARFCCRSCTEAGMLPPTGPHLRSYDFVQNDLA